MSLTRVPSWLVAVIVFASLFLLGLFFHDEGGKLWPDVAPNLLADVFVAFGAYLGLEGWQRRTQQLNAEKLRQKQKQEAEELGREQQREKEDFLATLGFLLFYTTNANIQHLEAAQDELLRNRFLSQMPDFGIAILHGVLLTPECSLLPRVFREKMSVYVAVALSVSNSLSISMSRIHEGDNATLRRLLNELENLRIMSIELIDILRELLSSTLYIQAA